MRFGLLFKRIGLFGMNFGKYVFWNDEKELFKNNRDAINEFLFSVVHAATIILLVLMAVMAAISFKFN